MMDAAPPPRVALPDAPALAVGARAAALVLADGEVLNLPLDEAARHARRQPPLLCHARAVAARLGGRRFAALDVLELFAFVRPAAFCLPTPRGVAAAVGLPPPADLEDEAAALLSAARRLLEELAAHPARGAQAVAWTMARAGWSWGPAVLAALGVRGEVRAAQASFRVWERLPEWSEHAPEPPSGSEPVDPAEARRRLAGLLGEGAEPRPQQADYASAVCAAFAPRDEPGVPHMVLAEAGTGTGKTLGYVAPASLWAARNGGAVWISTYTRNLQRQLDAELDRLFPDAAAKARHIVVRKGRENYLCLLNYEEAVRGAGLLPEDTLALGLMARWLAATRDGDMVGGDFPGWLPDLVGRPRTLGLTDRRGECIHAGCPHYRRCFIERTVRRARRADIVVANHALVMVQAALGGLDDGHLPLRYVFDEGHHVFDAADGAFSAHLCAIETAELRRWLLGAEEGARSRARGMKARLEDLLPPEGAAAAEALDAALAAARALPGPGWHQRLFDAHPRPLGAAEAFLALGRRQVMARARWPDSPYSLEAETAPPVDGLPAAATALAAALARLEEPLRRLTQALARRLGDEAADLDTATRQRIEAACRGIDRRALRPLAAWQAMLAALTAPPEADFVDWFAVERIDGRDIDVGLHRHWVDPTRPFAQAVAMPAHGVLVTSATLRDGSGDLEADWRAAERRTGAAHLPALAVRAAVPSPFDYAAQTRVLVVTDVRKDDMAQVAAAYRDLFRAAGGGALGLFTAISRLKAVHRHIAAPLEEAGVALLAQHVDGLDTSALVDIFRAEEDACLLGTDAVRDGVDVPGRSLRLIVFDRVPWPRPDIVHKARRAAFGGRAYDDMITRLRLKQAFGRLVRRADDKGVFVLLDPMMPSRLLGAFPEGVAAQRLGLAEAVTAVARFLGSRDDRKGD